MHPIEFDETQPRQFPWPVSSRVFSSRIIGLVLAASLTACAGALLTSPAPATPTAHIVAATRPFIRISPEQSLIDEKLSTRILAGSCLRLVRIML